MYHLDYIKESLRPETELMYLRQSVVSRDLAVKELENAVVRPGMGITVGEDFLDESYLHVNHNAPKSFRFNPEDCVESDEEVVFIGMFINIWGHCLTDCMKHLWIFLNEEERFKCLPLVYVKTREDIRIPDNFWKMLELLGVDLSRVREVKENTRFSKVYLPDQCFWADENNYHRLCTKEYSLMFDKIISSVEPREDCPKVYLTRSQLKVHNRDYGERSIEKVFRKKGYKVFAPEKLSLVEMIALLKGCSSFAATDGSIAHNSLFLHRGTECVFIRKADTVNSYQAPITQSRELNVTIIDANGSRLLYNKRAPWDGPFFVYCNSRMRRWSGVHVAFPLKEFCRYLVDYSKNWIKSKLSYGK